jgi:acetate kinase
MKILVINSGSSSLKYQLFNMKDESVLAKGIIHRIGIDNSYLEYEYGIDQELTIEKNIDDHKSGIQLLLDTILDKEYGVINNIEEIEAIGHRIVHGGEEFASSILIKDSDLSKIEKVSDLAPLHNPANIMGIKVFNELMPDKPQVGVFDTAFHQTMPKKSYLYALPYSYYQDYAVRRYGFHGTSHSYVARRAAEMLNEDLSEIKLISCHLGNGGSLTAVKNGKSIDTSMGMTPLEGLVMGSRCGDIDPAIVPFISEKEKLNIKQIDDILNKKSGLLGVSGISSDFRDVEEAAKNGNERAETAVELFNYRVKKYIGAYSAAMSGVDVIVFTAGIGENSISARNEILAGLEYLGIEIDENRNNCRGQEQIISKPSSEVKVLVIPTNEELVIARDTVELLNN